LSGRPDHSRRQHGDIAHSGADIQDTLTIGDARRAEKSFGARLQVSSLPD